MVITERTRILVLDDDPEIRELLTDFLTKSGFEVVAVRDSKRLDRVLIRSSFDLLILDLMLPGEDGITVAKRLKKQTKMPIIMLSALAETSDRISGLDIGADDYVGKPFDPNELVARIKAVLRRSMSSVMNQDEHVFSFGDYELDTETYRITKKGNEIFLTTAEFDLLALFVREPNRVMDRDLIHLRMTGSTRGKLDRTVDVRITRLRSKIEPHPNTPLYIKTVWQKGYMFCPNPSRVLSG